MHLNFLIVITATVVLQIFASPINQALASRQTLSAREKWYQDPICLPTGPDWKDAKPAKYRTVRMAVDVLNKHPNDVISQGPRSCSRIACVEGAGIYLCNDAEYEVSGLRLGGLAVMAEAIRNRCGPEQAPSYGQCYDATHTYNIITRYSRCGNVNDWSESD